MINTSPKKGGEILQIIWLENPGNITVGRNLVCNGLNDNIAKLRLDCRPD